MTKNDAVKVSFESIRFTLGEFESKALAETDVSVEGFKVIYVSQARYSIKGKDLKSVELVDEFPGGQKLLILQVLDAKTNEAKKFELIGPVDGDFDKFFTRLRRIQERNGVSLNVAQATDFLQTSSRKALGTKKAAPSYRRVTTSTKTARRGVFGSTRSIGSPTPNKLQSGDDLFFNRGQKKPVLVAKEEQMVKAAESPSPTVATMASDDDDNNFFDQSDEATPPKDADSPKPSLRQRKTRIKSKLQTFDDSDDEDFSRIDSPKSSLSPTRVTSSRKQASIQTYFTSKRSTMLPKRLPIDASPKPSSFDPASRAVVRTPLRPALSQRDTNSASNRSHKSPLKTDMWLSTSQSHIRSSDEQRKRELGIFRPASAIEEDPVEEDDDSQTKSVTTGGSRIVKRPRLMLRLNMEKHIEISDKPEPKKFRFRGLKNLGNTCYMNASLQMLLSANSFISSIQGKGGKLTAAVSDIAIKLQDTTSSMAENPSSVKDAVDAKTDKFLGFEQRDAHEFLADLIDSVHEELQEELNKEIEHNLNLSESPRETAVPEDAAINNAAPKVPYLPTDDFRLTLQACLKCESCGYERSKEEMYRHLSIDIVEDHNTTASSNGKSPIQASVEMSLNHFFQEEIREIKCEKCKNGTHAKQTLRLTSHPKFLLLHLKRFIFVEKEREAPSEENAPPNGTAVNAPPEYVYRKNKTAVAIPHLLSLRPFEVVQTDGQPDYSLVSIVHHIGSRASSGHYTADAVRTVKKVDWSIAGVSEPDGDPRKWTIFDDMSSTFTSYESIKSNKNKLSSAYMLLYSLNQK